MIVGKAMILRQVAGAGTHMSSAGAFAKQSGLAFPAAGDAEHDLDERGLAGAVLAAQAVNLPPAYLARHAGQGLDAAVVFAQVVGFQDWHWRTSQVELMRISIWPTKHDGQCRDMLFQYKRRVRFQVRDAHAAL